MDIPVVFSSAVNNGDPESRRQFNIQMEMTVSTLEHQIPEHKPIVSNIEKQIQRLISTRSGV